MVETQMAIKIKIQPNNSWLKESGYSIEQESDIYDSSIQDILDNTRWYLDNLDYLREYKVSWHCYTRTVSNGKNVAVLPFKKDTFINKSSPVYKVYPTGR